MHKRINNTNRIVRRGCSASRGCNAPDDGQSSSFDTITCCTSHKCNQGLQIQPLFLLSILSLIIIIII